MAKQDQGDEHVVISPAAEAANVSPPKYEDDVLTDSKGNRRSPPDGAEYRYEHLAKELGTGAGHVTYAAGIEENVAEPLSRHHELDATLGASGPQRDLDEQLHGHRSNLLAAHLGVPLVALDPVRKRLALVGKALLVAGDTAIVGNQIWRSGGSPMLLALVLGLAIAGSVVAVGAKAGQQIAAAQQRRQRGPLPDGAPANLRAYYDDQATSEMYRFWLFALGATGLVMGVSVFMIGFGSGDGAVMSLGYGFVASLTVLGSAAVEAYATNQAGEELVRLGEEHRTSRDLLNGYAGAEGNAARARSLAATGDLVARHHAVAADGTTRMIAYRQFVAEPRIGGYFETEAMPATESAPKPTEIVHPGAPAPRERQRRSYRLDPSMASGTSPDIDMTQASGEEHEELEGLEERFSPTPPKRRARTSSVDVPRKAGASSNGAEPLEGGSRS
jgi:hypothetical protein